MFREGKKGEKKDGRRKNKNKEKCRIKNRINFTKQRWKEGDRKNDRIPLNERKNKGIKKTGGEKERNDKYKEGGRKGLEKQHLGNRKRNQVLKYKYFSLLIFSFSGENTNIKLQMFLHKVILQL